MSSSTNHSEPRGPLWALDAWFMRPAPPERLAALRVIVGLFALVYLLVRTPQLVRLTRLPATYFAPVGVLRLCTSAPEAWAVWSVLAVTLVLAFAFLFGRFHRVVGPLFAACFLWILTYENSFQTVLHVANLLVVYVCVLGLTPCADAWVLRAPSGGPAAELGPAARYGWPLKLMQVLCVASYVVAGIAKLKYSGLAYAHGDVLPIQVAFDNMRKIELGSFYSPVGVWLVPFRTLWTALGALTLGLELGAPLALLGGRVALYWIMAMWGFHLGVLLTMLIFFPFPLLGGAFAPFFRAEKLPQVLRFKRRSTVTPGDPSHAG